MTRRSRYDETVRGMCGAHSIHSWRLMSWNWTGLLWSHLQPHVLLLPDILGKCKPHLLPLFMAKEEPGGDNRDNNTARQLIRHENPNKKWYGCRKLLLATAFYGFPRIRQKNRYVHYVTKCSKCSLFMTRSWMDCAWRSSTGA